MYFEAEFRYLYVRCGMHGHNLAVMIMAVGYLLRRRRSERLPLVANTNLSVVYGLMKGNTSNLTDFHGHRIPDSKSSKQDKHWFDQISLDAYDIRPLSSCSQAFHSFDGFESSLSLNMLGLGSQNQRAPKFSINRNRTETSY